MTSARVIEYRITRDLLSAAALQASPQPRRRPPAKQLVERMIGVAAGAATLLLLGSLFPELVISALAASLIISLK